MRSDKDIWEGQQAREFVVVAADALAQDRARARSEHLGRREIVGPACERNRQARAEEAVLREKRGRIPWCFAMKSTSARLCDKWIV